MSAKTVSTHCYPNGFSATLAHPGDTLSYGYDLAGQMIELDYSLGTAAWEYLANGLLAKQTVPNEPMLAVARYGRREWCDVQLDLRVVARRSSR